MKQYSRTDQWIMATWALDCAERVLPLFEAAAPGDRRPRDAIEAGRAWVDTGDFSMPVIRTASLGAHDAARTVEHIEAARLAARAAGQAVATAHVAQHAYGGAYYALRAVAAAHDDDQARRVQAELAWQASRLPAHLRDEIMAHLVVRVVHGTPRVSLVKGPDF